MTIFDRDPRDWRELQTMTGQMFTEIGCEVEVGKKLEIVRGTKEIDVYARDSHAVPPAVYLCECKFWRRPVPQEVVHAFRTVILDAGAHRGFIISNAGFQQGAFEAARNTNTDLVTFKRLQEIFFDRWRVAMAERFVPYADRLFPYWDFPGRMPRFRWRKDHVERQQRLKEAYQPLLHLGPFARMKNFVRTFPIVRPRSIRGERFMARLSLTPIDSSMTLSMPTRTLHSITFKFFTVKCHPKRPPESMILHEGVS